MSEIKLYLQSKGIQFRESGGELITKCIFSSCDSDSHGSEAHLYFDSQTGLYNCKKCDEKGNLITLKKHFKDPVTNETPRGQRNTKTVTPVMVEKAHQQLLVNSEALEYLYSRGLTAEVIARFKIGHIFQYNTYWITFPITDVDNNYSFFKLRQDPKYGNDKRMWPASEDGAQIFTWEMDTLLLQSHGIESICGTAGAGTWKESWNKYIRPELEYFICYDNDKTGKEGAVKVAESLYKSGCRKIMIIDLPEEVGEKGDLGDYLVRLKLPQEDLFTKYVRLYPERIDTSKFEEIDLDYVKEILDSTIKKDDANKLITFLGGLTTYTEESQVSILFNAPSSVGKSHIPLSVKDLFPKEDLIILANCSPMAFFHEQGAYEKEKNEFVVDLSRKIIIFTDMPHTQLIERLRPLLSHDTKHVVSKITDKNQKGGNKTKTVIIIGYPTVFFCTASSRIDEQESTRFIMLSPSVDQDKITAGIKQSIEKESNQGAFRSKVESNPRRALIKERILAIKQEHIDDVIIEDYTEVEKLYLENRKALKPRHQRDVKKVISVIKGLTLLNLWFRKRDGNNVYSTTEDIKAGIDLWNEISEGQDYGISPYVLSIYKDIILSIWHEPVKDPIFGERKHIERQEVLDRHYTKFGRPLSSAYLRNQILPQLDSVGLITQERHPENGRRMVIIPQESDLDPDTNIVLPLVGVNLDNIPDGPF
jgi:DNA primase